MPEARTFHCPTCGAPLGYIENAAVIHCTYCKNVVLMPESLRGKVSREGNIEQSQQEALDDIYLMVANNKKIEAIKRLCDLSGLSLTEAKEIADAMERGDNIVPEAVFQIKENKQVKSLDQGDLLELTRQGKKIEAIRQVRLVTGLGLKESKDIVDALEQGNDLPLLSAMDRNTDDSQAGRLSQRGEWSGQTVQAGSPVRVVINEKAAVAAGTVAASAGCGIPLLGLFILVVTFIPILLSLTLDGGPLAPLMTRINPLSYASMNLSLSGEGVGPGQFTDPRAIAVDKDGNFYVADYSTGRVQSFDAQGSFRWMTNMGRKVNIRSMAVDPTGVLYVIVSGKLNRLEASTGKDLGVFETENRYYFDDISIAPDGRIALIYRGENILVMNSELQTLFEIEEAVSSITEDSELSSEISVDSLGNIFVLGSFNKMVLKYSPSGKYITQFGGATFDPSKGKFRAPGDLSVDMEGRVYVSDTYGLQVFDNEGQFITSFKAFGYVYGMVFDHKNQLYLTDNKPMVARFQLKH
jgi:ribosomal protein L7/L12/DNA-binding beta-propeller fold protein YncE